MLGEAGVYNTKNFNFTVNILLFLLHFSLHAPKTIGEQTPFFISKFKKTVCCEKLHGGGGGYYIFYLVSDINVDIVYQSLHVQSIFSLENDTLTVS